MAVLARLDELDAGRTPEQRAQLATAVAAWSALAEPGSLPAAEGAAAASLAPAFGLAASVPLTLVIDAIAADVDQWSWDALVAKHATPPADGSEGRRMAR